MVQLKGHTKKVNMKEDATIPGCNDNTVSLWNVMSGNQTWAFIKILTMIREGYRKFSKIKKQGRVRDGKFSKI